MLKRCICPILTNFRLFLIQQKKEFSFLLNIETKTHALKLKRCNKNWINLVYIGQIRYFHFY